jgi:hypothetical protein
VRAYALWDGWFGYDRRKYTQFLHDAFDPLTLVRGEQLPSRKPKAATKNR